MLSPRCIQDLNDDWFSSVSFIYQNEHLLLVAFSTGDTWRWRQIVQTQQYKKCLQIFFVMRVFSSSSSSFVVLFICKICLSLFDSKGLVEQMGPCTTGFVIANLI